MSWNFRVVKKEGIYGVYEVYYNSKDEIIGMTENTVSLVSDNHEDLILLLARMAGDLDSPVLDYADIKSSFDSFWL
jgi:hypothetical protein